MTKSHHYVYGLPFSEVWASNLIDFRDRVLKYKKASLIIIDGGLGSGKTTFAVQSSDFINGAYEKEGNNWVLKEENFIDIKDQVALGGEAFIQKLKICYEKKKVVLVYDEGGDFAGRGAITKFNRLLNRVFDVYRAFKVVVFLVLPCVGAIDTSIFDKGIVRCLVHCHNRTNAWGSFKVFNTKSVGFLLEKMRRLGKNRKLAYNYVIPNFRGTFLDLMPDRSKELEDYTIEGKLEVLGDVNLVLSGLMKKKDLAVKIGRSVSWVNKALKQNKIEPKKVHKRFQYFDDDALTELLEFREKVESGKESLEV